MGQGAEVGMGGKLEPLTPPLAFTPVGRLEAKNEDRCLNISGHQGSVEHRAQPGVVPARQG